MAIGYLRVSVAGRAGGGSAVAAAAYRAGEKQHDNELNHDFDFTKKQGVVHSEIMLPENAPVRFKDRQELWNDVEAFEQNSNSRFYREITVALPRELDHNQQIALARDYIKNSFVDDGMCADFAIHDKSDGNPHLHIMLTTRPLDKDGNWSKFKEQKSYALDKNGNRIPVLDLKTGKQKIGAHGRKMWKRVSTKTNKWDKPGMDKIWKAAWDKHANVALRKAGIDIKIDTRAYADRDNLDQLKIGSRHLPRREYIMHQKLGVPLVESDVLDHNRYIETHVKPLVRQLDKAAELVDTNKTELINAYGKSHEKETPSYKNEQIAKAERIAKRTRHDEFFRRRARQKHSMQNLEKRRGVRGQKAQMLRKSALGHGEESVTLYKTPQDVVRDYPNLDVQAQVKKQLKNFGDQYALKHAKAICAKPKSNLAFIVGQKSGKTVLCVCKLAAGGLDAVSKVCGCIPVIGAPVKMVCGLPQKGINTVEKVASNLTACSAGRQTIGKTLSNLGRTAKDFAKEPYNTAKQASGQARQMFSQAGQAPVQSSTLGKIVDRVSGESQQTAVPQLGNIPTNLKADYEAARGTGYLAEQARHRLLLKELLEEEFADADFRPHFQMPADTLQQVPVRVRTLANDD